MRKIVLFSLLALISSACAKQYVCYRHAKKLSLSGLTSLLGQSADCRPNYTKPSNALAQRINELFASPIITMDSKLITCCKERAGESAGVWTTDSDGKVQVPAGMDNRFIVNM